MINSRPAFCAVGLFVTRAGGPGKRTLSTVAMSPRRWNHRMSLIALVRSCLVKLSDSSSDLSFCCTASGGELVAGDCASQNSANEASQRNRIVRDMARAKYRGAQYLQLLIVGGGSCRAGT